MPRKPVGIARKIWLGYAVPLAVLAVAGVLVPAALSAFLGRITLQYEASARFVDQVRDMATAVADAEAHVREYVLSGDGRERIAYRLSLRDYREIYTQAAPFVLSDRALQVALNRADRALQAWRNQHAEPLVRLRGAGAQPQRRPTLSAGRASFQQVRAALARLETAAQARRDRQKRGALAAEQVRRVMMLIGPIMAFALALLIGRSISLGVTRPLETLTQATEALARGQTTRLQLAALGDETDDEIGDLKRAFEQMARTIGQREAVLRAQNDTLGAIRRRVEAVLNATNDGILLLDRAGGFSLVNERCGVLFGVAPDTLLDQTFDKAGPLLLAGFKNAEEVASEFRALLDNAATIADTTYETIEPIHRVLRVYSAPVHGEGEGAAGGDLLGRIFVFRDVTQETAVDRMKTEFISVVSHELRTPLTAIKGYVDLVVGEQTGPLNDLQREFLQIVQRSTGRLSHLINDMLDVSRIEGGRLELRHEAVDFAPLARDAAAMLNNEAAAKNIALRVDLPADMPPVKGDVGRIMQVLLNLIGNGIKYTPAGGAVCVRATNEDTFVTTCVEDTGIGISADDQAHLFQKFFRADNSSTRAVGGTGLGLAITKAILEKLHGSIWVESAPGQGSRFYFTLPAAPRAAAATEAAAAGQPRPGPEGNGAAAAPVTAA